MIGAYFLAGAPIQNSYPSGYLPYYLILPYQPELQPAPYIQYPLPSSETTEVTTKRVTTSEKEIRSEPKKKTVGRKKKKGGCFGLFPLKIRIIILGVPKKKVQNPERNVLTNICSQLMSFLLSKQKCGPIFQQILKNKPADWERDYYASLKKLKIKFSGYYNMDKVRELWFGSESDLAQVNHEEYLKMRRMVSNIYIETKLIRSLLTSKKLSNRLKIAHMKLRRQMSRVLRKQEEVTVGDEI